MWERRDLECSYHHVPHELVAAWRGGGGGGSLERRRKQPGEGEDVTNVSRGEMWCGLSGLTEDGTDRFDDFCLQQ